MEVGHLKPLIVALQAGVNVIILTGPPGTGKTAFTRWWAGVNNLRWQYLLCHRATDWPDLFWGPDPVGLLAPESGHSPVQAGVFGRVVEGNAPSVVVLDEVDKASPRFDALLLDVLQTMEIPSSDGRQRINVGHRLRAVFLTSNGERELSDPLLRRCFRWEMKYLPPEAEVRLLGGSRAAKLLVNLANKLRQVDPTSAPALSELERALTLARAADSPEMARLFLLGALQKRPEQEGAISAAALEIWRAALAETKRK